MRRYAIDNTFSGGLYKVAGTVVRRGNRNAAGMSAHAERRRDRLGHHPKLSDAALKLTVNGTCDPLASVRFDLGRAVCTCCGAKTDKRILTGKPSKARRVSLALNPARLP
ncbi:hypothetical protein BAMBUS_05600 [Brevundimonas phage vB_BpoS-Bambus]|nr:hypothetical protein BAMBUS_05600 [Brevundimonas phage vB_BpoS-Bambus]